MKVFNTLSVLASSASLASVTAECFKGSPFHQNDWSYCQPINDDLFMYYTPLGETIMLGLHATKGVKGWSSLSLSGNGGMKGASQIIVRRDDSTDEWIAEDRYSSDYAQPILDEKQDVQLLFADQDEETGQTAWGVVIPKISCDPFDYDIDDHRSFMLWAFGPSHSLNFHGSSRGQFLANLLAPPAEQVDFNDYDRLPLTMPNVEVVRGEPELDPANPFICSYFDLDHLGKEFDFTSEDKIHMVGYDTTATPGNEKYLHHMVLFECNGDAGEATESERDFGENFPFHGKVIQSCTAMPAGCQQPAATWAVGAGANVLPEDVGISIGGGSRWLVLQMHYFNPDIDEDVYDSSGLNLYFTKDLRQIEGGVMFFSAGAATGQHPPLPGGEKDVAMETLYVEPDCTAQWTGPLTVMSVHHHSHFMGTFQEIVVERDGTNMGPLRKEHRYDYNHQAGVEPEATLSQLFPGDRIAATCHFDTTSVPSSEVVEIGEESNREMCIPFIYYYPKQETADFFFYFPPEDAPKLIGDHAWCSMPPTEEEGAFGNMCVEKLYSNVPQFAHQTFAWYGYDETSFTTYSELCNGGDETAAVREALEICPQECAETKSCSNKELIDGAKGVCEHACSTLGLSLYPDDSRTELFGTSNLSCPTPFFDPPTMSEPEECKVKGSLPVDIALTYEWVGAEEDPVAEAGEEDFVATGVVEVEVDSGSSSHLASTAMLAVAMLTVVVCTILM